jgi:Sec-independent protein translocase protein TatA
VKKVAVCVLLLLLGLPLSLPAAAQAGTNAMQTTAQRGKANGVRKQYVRHQRKAAKKARKAQTRASKTLRAQHPAGH